MITGASLAISGYGVSRNGSLNVDESLGNGSTLNVFATSSSSSPFDSQTFAGTGGFSVQDTITLNGGTADTASSAGLQTVLNSFSQTPAPPVPEPSSMILLGSGVLGVFRAVYKKMASR